MDATKPAIEARRAYAGPEFLRDGFRPFFLGAGIWAVCATALWMAELTGFITVPSAFAPVVWHAHEMLFGFVAATVAGFLLTAIPNWTGRLPVRGRSLAVLFALWAVGRIAVGASAPTGPGLAAGLDLVFPVALCVVVWREIWAGGNWRNLPIAGIWTVFVLSNLLVHLEALSFAATGDFGLRLGIGTIACLIALVGGRIVPSFTRNWLAKRKQDKLPKAFGRLDRAALAAVVAACLAWVIAPTSALVGLLCVIAALLSALRLAAWQGLRTGSEPLVWVLHLGYAWLVVGFALLGMAILVPDLPQTAALHALTAGAMGTMTLAVMTRAILGHTGRSLRAGPGTVAIYALASIAALARVLAQIGPGVADLLLGLSGIAWIAAFAVFVVLYGPLMIRPRHT